MVADCGQKHFWDPAVFDLQTTGAIDYTQDYSNAPFDPTLSIFNHLIHTSSTIQESTGDSSDPWHSQQGKWSRSDSTPSLGESSSSHHRSERPHKLLIEPQPHTKRRTRKPPSGEALERRREQNRTAQLAFRDRSKKQVEELRQELTKCVEFNQKLFSTLRELLDRTDSLKRDIEAALALQPSRSGPEFLQPSRATSSELFSSPAWSNESPGFDYDAESNW